MELFIRVDSTLIWEVGQYGVRVFVIVVPSQVLFTYHKPRTSNELTLIRVEDQSQAMSLFSDIGRKVEKTKQALIDGKQVKYVCVSCEELVDEDYEYCPHCGEETVEPVS